MRARLRQLYERSVVLRSLRVQILVLMLLFGLIPCVLVHRGIIISYEDRAVALRISEVQTQMRVLANHLINYDFLSDPTLATVNAELDQFSTLHNGRVLVINDQLRVLRDSYGISDGKIIVSREVVRCLREGTSATTASYDKENHFIEFITPIVETAALEPGDYTGATAQETVRGVLLTSVSTDSIIATRDILSRRALLIEGIVLLVVLALALILSGVLTRPFRKLTTEIEDVGNGFTDRLDPVLDLRETQRVTEAFNQVLTRMRTLDESRAEFVSNVSHELKTPMTSMKVLADSLLAQEDVDAETYREFLEDIDREIDRENKIISDLLSLVRLDSQSVAMNVTSVDIVGLTEIILKRLRPLAQKRDIELTMVNECEITAEVDEVKLTLVLTNLVENAIKYNKDHGVVTVTLDADQRDFTISVEDTGIGIPEEAVDRIYERFYRVDKSRSREVGGTGLGLAIARNAVRMHRGTINLKTVPGEGSVFTIKIPLNYIAPPKGKGGGKERRA